MPRRTPTKSAERGEKADQIYGDYAVALNEKSKLETENALLRLATKEQDGKLSKLKLELSECLMVLSKANEQLGDTEQQLKLREETHEQERKGYRKEIDRHENSAERLKANISFFMDKLEKKQQKLSKLREEMEMYKVKCRKYKEKLRQSLELLQNLHGLVKEKSEMAPKMRQTRKHCGDEGCYDDGILSELFFKENPFMESLYG